MRSKLYNIMEKGISWIALIFCGMLFLSGFLGTAYAEDMSTQVALLKWDNLLISAVMILGATILGILLFRVMNQNIGRSKKILLCLVMLWYLGAGLFLAFFGRTVPAADAMSVYQLGECIACGDLSIIHPTDSYLSFYPQQLGLATFLAVLLYFINLLSLSIQGFHLLKVVYVFLICIILFFAYKIVEKVWENDGITCLFLLLCLANFPLIVFSSFVYGEVPGFCAFVVSVYYLVRCIKENKHSVFYPAMSILFMTLAVWLRKNMLIMLIGVLIICIGQFLHTKRRCWCVYGILFAVCGLSLAPITENAYETASGREIKSGVTAMSYLAMGMQEASRGPGWYNGFNFITYQNSGMDTDLANEISLEAINERMAEFAEKPAYALNFYARKYLTQWIDGTYASRQAVLAEYGGRLQVIQEVYDGKYSWIYVELCNQVQNLIYLGSFLWSISIFAKVRKEKKGYLACYLGIIIVFGGFLFHMMWEANGRYILMFGQILFFYAAAGWYDAGQKIIHRLRSMKGMQV